MKVAVVQPLPGIGDTIWHLPHIRAIAAFTGGPVTLVTKPRSAADQIFSAESTVSDCLWIDRNPENRRGRDEGLGALGFVRKLRARNFDRIYLLHHSKTLAIYTALAGIPERYGYVPDREVHREDHASSHDDRRDLRNRCLPDP